MLIYATFYSVHTPLMARDDLKKKFNTKREKLGLKAEWGQERDRKVRHVQEHAVYAGMVEALDLAVGKVLQKLDALGPADDTAKLHKKFAAWSTEVGAIMRKPR